MGMSVNAANALRGVLAGIEDKLDGRMLPPDMRQTARRIFDRGGRTANEVFGLDVGAVKPVKRRVKAAPGGAPKREVVKNHEDGHRRERLLEKFLKVIFPKKDEYRVYREQYLRTKDGAIAVDVRTHESRRVDFVVYHGDQLVRSIEVTSRGVDKAPQLRKEAAIREAGGSYMLDPAKGKLVKVPAALTTKVVRLA